MTRRPLRPGAGVPHVLVLVQNNSVPSDRRVWNEVTALRAAGYAITVVCPRGDGRDSDAFELRDGVEIHRFVQRTAGDGAVGYVVEYAAAMLSVWRGVRRVARRRHVDVVHACNPPDLLLLCAASLRRRGTRFVFDHHDLAPELYLARLGRGEDIFHRLSLLVERLNFRLADVVLSTNGSYRRIAMERGGKRPEDVFVVRSAPVLARFTAVDPDPALRHGREHLLAYVGEMAPQDGLEHALRALGILHRDRTDWHAVFAGEGPVVEDLRRLASELGIAEHVEFCGWLQDAELRTLLSTADVCLAPDPKTALADKSTLVKIAEYLALSRPVVSYDLTESRVTAGDAAIYARADDPQAFADAIGQLLDDPERRRRMGAVGRARVETGLAWEHSERELLAAYEHVLRWSCHGQRA